MVNQPRATVLYTSQAPPLAPRCAPSHVQRGNHQAMFFSDSHSRVDRGWVREAAQHKANTIDTHEKKRAPTPSAPAYPLNLDSRPAGLLPF